MCTVTFIATSNGFVISSNRDEKISREKAISPKSYEINSKKVVFPKDQKAGGTWIAHTEKKVVVLLNGAKEKHQAKSFYRKSRGLIVTEIASSNSSLDYWNRKACTKVLGYCTVGTIICRTNRIFAFKGYIGN